MAIIRQTKHLKTHLVHSTVDAGSCHALSLQNGVQHLDVVPRGGKHKGGLPRRDDLLKQPKQGCNLLLGPAGSNLLSNLNADALGVDSSSHKPFSVQGCAAKAFHNASWQQGLTGQRRRQVTGQGMHQFMLTQVAAQVGQIGIQCHPADS